MGDLKIIFQKWVAILIVLVLFMGQYAITGFLATSYAIDLLATQSENVQFRAYFKNGEEELTDIESSIDAKDLKLKIDVAVKNQGYFNGKISLANAGFELDQATANSYIKKVENNIIYLNQINSEETAKIEVGIKYFEDDKIQASTLSQTTTVKLNGTYTGSNGNTTIDGGSDVKVTWKVPENTKAELASTIQTNFKYLVNEENKRIVQFLTSSRLTNNAYPVKNAQITAIIPEGATNVEVHKRTTKATNGEQDFTSANYNVENNILTININNTEEDGKVSWMKNVLDILVVTLEYPESAELSTQNITVNEKITTQNNIELNAEQVQLSLTDTIDRIASVSKQEKETNIYKGKIYSGEGRDITSYTLVHVDYVDGVKDIEITEYGGIFGKNEDVSKELRERAIETGKLGLIKSIRINKDKVASVLGSTWSLTIGEQTITNETQADENGNISLDLGNDVKILTIKTSKPVNNGSFIIETTKNISKGDYTREQIKEFEKIADNSSIKYVKNNDDVFIYTNTYNIGLKEPESKASLQSEQTALIAGSTTQALNLIAILESSGEHQDLYKNPEIKIKLPSQIKNVSFAQKPQLMHADNELTITEGNYTVTEENGQKVLNIKVTGEQTKYLGEAVKGVTILINTNVLIDSDATNSNEEIVMTYTNENATKYKDNGTQKVNIQIQAQSQGGNTGSEGSGTGNQSGSEGQGSESGQQGGSTESGSQNENSEISYNVSAKVGGEAIAQGDTVKAGEIITYTAKISNQGTTDKTGLKIEATIPENTTLIQVNPNYPKYDEEMDEYIDGEEYFNKLSQITTLKQENISVGAGKEYNYSFMVMVNEDITEEKNIETKIIFSENNEKKDEKNFSNKISPAKFQVTCVPLYRKPGELLLSGYNYKYEIKITNLTNEEQRNIKLSLNTSDTLEMNTINWKLDKERKGEIQLDNNTLNFETLAANKTITVTISATVNLIEKNGIVTNTAEINAETTDLNGNKYKSNDLKEKITGSNLTAQGISEVTTELTKQGYVQAGDKIKYLYKIKNIGLEDIEDLMIRNNFSKYLKLESVKLNGENSEYNKDLMDLEEYEYDVLEITTSIESQKEITLEIIGEVTSDLPDYKENLKAINKTEVYSEGIKACETSEIVYNIELPKADYSDGSELGIEEEPKEEIIGEFDINQDIQIKDEDQDKDDQPNSDQQNSDQQNSDQQNSDQPNSDQQNGNQQNSDQQTDTDKITEITNSEDVSSKNAISGTAWLDTNGNGQKELEEQLLDGIKATLFDVEKNSEISSIVTNNGLYNFTNVSNGKYIIIFEYDTGKYTLTTYQAEGVDQSSNSDVENITMNLNGENKRVASTDTLILTDNSITNVDIGLVEAKKFDLSLSKTISKVSVSNSSGNKEYEFSDTNLAKVEIKGKYLKDSVVIVEYKIKVTNNGELAGYAKKIVDNKPSELKFNSKLNSDWYQSGNILYTTSLANEIIEPGETKELTLILTKTMTASNTGLTNNKAEIAEYYNSQGIVDENSSQDDDISQADLIVSVSTGAVVGYIAITLLIATIISTALVAIIKKLIIK